MSKEILGNIRTTKDRWICVIDLLQVINEDEHPLKTWEKICLDNPEIARNSKKHNFPDSDSEATPIVDGETALRIIDLLPDNFQIQNWENAIKSLTDKV